MRPFLSRRTSVRRDLKHALVLKLPDVLRGDVLQEGSFRLLELLHHLHHGFPLLPCAGERPVFDGLLHPMEGAERRHRQIAHRVGPVVDVDEDRPGAATGRCIRQNGVPNGGR